MQQEPILALVSPFGQKWNNNQEDAGGVTPEHLEHHHAHHHAAHKHNNLSSGRPLTHHDATQTHDSETTVSAETFENDTAHPIHLHSSTHINLHVQLGSAQSGHKTNQLPVTNHVYRTRSRSDEDNCHNIQTECGHHQLTLQDNLSAQARLALHQPHAPDQLAHAQFQIHSMSREPWPKPYNRVTDCAIDARLKTNVTLSVTELAKTAVTTVPNRQQNKKPIGDGHLIALLQPPIDEATVTDAAAAIPQGATSGILTGFFEHV